MNSGIKIHTESCVAFEVIQKLKVNSRLINFNCRNIKTNLYARDDLVHRRGSNEHVLGSTHECSGREASKNCGKCAAHTQHLLHIHRSLRPILHIEHRTYQ